jgi:hypothetical protein
MRAARVVGEAVRKAKIDLNVDIEFTPMKTRRRGDDLGAGQLAWAIGDISYPRQPGERANARRRTGKISITSPAISARTACRAISSPTPG